MAKRLCPDPDCKTENEGDVQFCSKCGLDIDGFFQLDKIHAVRDKIARKKAEDDKAAADQNKKTRKGLAGLIR